VMNYLNPQYIAYGLLLISITLITISIPFSKVVVFAQAQWQAKAAELQEHMEELNMSDYEPNQLMAMALFISTFLVLVGGGLLGYYIAAFGSAILILISDRLYFPWARAKLRKDFDEKFPMALDQIVSATRAGLNLAQAMEDVSRLAPAPIDGELQKIVRENRMGSDMATALSSARKRLKSHTFDLVVSALLVNMRQGGDLPKALERMSQALKEIWRLEQKIFTASAEARKGAQVMSFMPVVIFFMVASMQPEMIDQLTGSLMGFGILAIAALLYGLGMMWMFKIIRVEV
jgi:tight adherence protein B